MKSNLLLSIAVIGFMATPALSQQADWSGAYGTIVAGYSAVELNGSQTGAFTETDSGWSDGGTFGVGAGYNADMGNFVFGLDTDISLLTNQEQLDLKNTVEADADWFATARARVGVDANDFLIYGTGGLALLGAEFTENGDQQRETFVGWTAGAGVEHMISDNVSVKLEGLYADFGKENFALDGFDTNFDGRMVVVRAGLTLHF